MRSSATESWNSLYDIAEMPAERVGTPLEFYSEFKLGKESAIGHYADLLTLPLIALLESDEPGPSEWYIVAPPMSAVPAAANLLAQRMLAILSDQDLRCRIHLHVLRKRRLESLILAGSYASHDFVGRQQYLEAEYTSWSGGDELADSFVIFLNDIYVTGAQENIQRRYFLHSAVRYVHWQYLLKVDRTSLQAAALEEPLNRSGTTTNAQFCQFLGGKDITITTKLLWRLLELPYPDFVEASQIMPRARCRRVLELLRKENAITARLMGNKIAVLEERSDSLESVHSRLDRSLYHLERRFQ